MKRQIKTLLFILITLLFSNLISAQTVYKDVVYLKNGGVIHGMIIEQIPNQSIKIQTKDRNIFVYKMDEIDRIEFATPYGDRRSNDPLDASQPYSGISFGAEMNIGSGLNSLNRNHGTISGHFLIGYMDKSTYFLGVSVGVNIWELESNNDQYVPFDVNFALRVFPVKKKYSPLLIADAGYSTVMSIFGEQTSDGGFTYKVGGGCHLNLTQRSAVNISLFYKAQQYHYTVNSSYNYYFGYHTTKHVSYLDAVGLELGFAF